MAQTQYNLAWQPGASLKQFRADYDANFSTDAEWVFYLRGSYNMTDIRALSVYINNKTNNDLVTVSGNNGQFVRQVPPYGEARLPLADIDVLSLTAPNGQTAIEFYNTPMAESIFQRTDTGTSLIQVSGGLGLSVGDLVTVDRIGRIQVADAKPFSANNTTSNFAAGTALNTWGPITYSANCYSFKDSLGRLVNTDGGGSGTNYYFNVVNNGAMNAQYALSNYNTANNCLPVKPIETANNYYFPNYKFATNSVSSFNKLTLTPGSGVTLSGLLVDGRMVLQGDSLSNDNYFAIGKVGTTLYVQEVVSGVPKSIHSNNTANVEWAASGGVWPFKIGRWVGVFLYSSTNTSLNFEAIQATNGNTAIGAFVSTIAPVNTWRANRWAETIYSGIWAICPYRDGSGFPSLYHVRDNGATMASGQIGVDTVSTTRFVCFALDNGRLAVAYNSAAGNIRVKIYDFSTSVVSLVSTFNFAIGGTATLLDVVEIPIDDSGLNYFLIVYYDGVNTQSFIVTQSMAEIVPFTTPIACPMPNNGWGVWNDSDEFAFFVTGAQPTVLQMELAKSVFGVNRGGGSIQMTGFSGINQNFPGSVSFNQNAAAVIGNRGVVFNSTVQLQGLTP